MSAAIVTGFVRTLRGAGLVVPVSSALSYAEALGEIGLDVRDHVYWAGRATLVRRPEDQPVYDRVFRAYWERLPAPGDDQIVEEQRFTIAIDDENADDTADGEAEPDPNPTITVRFSTTETLRHKDFSAYSDVELREFHQLMTTLAWSGAPRRSRRLAPTAASARLDLRRTIRAALRADGEAIQIHHRSTSTKPRRLVLLLDVSGSMEPYARALVRFVHAAVIGRRRVEVFTLGTRLTRVTRELASRDPDRAISQATRAVVDWSGGTRLGDGIGRFNDEWGQRGMARGSIVVVLSDGWDRGDPATMAEQMGRLHRVAHQVVWVNPLKATAGYAPLARGMAAALPYIDEFVEGHSLDAVERLAAVIAGSKR